MYIDAQINNASDLTETQAIHDAGLIILYNVTALALQTLFYGGSLLQLARARLWSAVTDEGTQAYTSC